MPVCETCGEQIEEGKTHKHKGGLFVHKGKIVCESCLIDAGIPISDATDYSTYMKLNQDMHNTGLNT